MGRRSRRRAMTTSTVSKSATPTISTTMAAREPQRDAAGALDHDLHERVDGSDIVRESEASDHQPAEEDREELALGAARERPDQHDAGGNGEASEVRRGRLVVSVFLGNVD